MSLDHLSSAQFSNRLASYSASSKTALRKSSGIGLVAGTVASFAVGTTESEAAIVVTNIGVTLDPASNAFEFHSVDIVGFGVGFDFTFQAQLDGTNPGDTADFVRMGAFDANNKVVGTTFSSAFNYVSRLNFGDPVSGALNFVDGDATVDSYLAFADSSGGFGYPDSGEWLGGQAGYVGFSITDGANTNYGWFEIITDADNATVTIVRYGIETTPGVVAVAGVPETNSLAFLALGAAGLLGWRNRRKAA